MKLTHELIRLELRHTWTIARGSSDYKENVIIRLERDGVVGYGEAAPNSRYDETPESTLAFIEQAIPLFAGADPWHFVELERAIGQLQPSQNAAKAGLDMALMDWVTKSLGLPLYRYLGLDPAKTPLTTFSIGIDSPEVIAAKVKEAAPYPRLKIKLGSDRDEEIVAAVRSVSDKPLLVDANEGWRDKHEALERIRWLEGQGIFAIEQPMPADQLDDMTWLRERVKVPLFADESVRTAADIPRLAQAFDGINIKLMKAGGLQEALRMIGMARALGLQVMLGCMVETSLAVSAAAALSPLADLADLDGNLLIKDDPFTGVTVEQGRLVLSGKPGLGAQPRN